MRLALISDIHGNLEALRAVLEDIERRKVDQIDCLGDVIGYGCDPVECLQLVEEHCTIKLMGNHEYAALGVLPPEAMNLHARQSIHWTLEQLGDRGISMISDFEMKAETEQYLLVHASPYEPDEWHYVLSEHEAGIGFDSFMQPLAFHGHTHLPMIFCKTPTGKLRTIVGHDFDPDEECRYLINVGSVGQPRDRDPRACYAIYDSNEVSVTYHRLDYDVEAAQAKMCRADMPQMLIERLEVGK
jgi:predicted phosphodiesterase